MASDPEFLLSCALTYKSSVLREQPIDDTFEDVEMAIQTLQGVLLHEARESLADPLPELPSRAHLLPVDIDTNTPGIVVADKRGKEEKEEVFRPPGDALKRISYNRCNEEAVSVLSQVPPIPTSSLPPLPSNREDAQVILRKELQKAERKAATERRRELRVKEKKQALANETPDDREKRLILQREKRKEAKRKKENETSKRNLDEISPSTYVSDAPAPQPVPDEECNPSDKKEVDDDGAEKDVSLFSVLAQLPRRKKKQSKEGDLTFFSAPLPHHRHLLGLQLCSVSACLRDALLKGEESESLEIIQGPPGTGKTRELVQRVKDCQGRVLLCAPTNVGAANLYTRCLAEGVEGVSIVLSRQRIPLGTHVLNEDPCSRVVCCTVTGRNGPLLVGQRFDNVFLDEAAQCMEAWTWTLLREEVTTLVLAGDIMQLPATVSESGKRLRHERSLMERLLNCLSYGNTVHLRVQNRMAPEICAVPNDFFYSSSLVQGPLAPLEGSISFIVVSEEEGGAEEKVGNSFRNEGEGNAISALISRRQRDTVSGSNDDCVIITPYAGQTRYLLSLKMGKEVHTIDSFQGREADTVILSVVRDGRQGLGFWSEERRLVVALTRARHNLIVVASSPDKWDQSSCLYRLWDRCKSTHED